MNNIPNAIRRLQSSTKLRSQDITNTLEAIANLKAYRTHNAGIVPRKYYDVQIFNHETALKKYVTDQQVEKKLLAMMYYLQRNRHNPDRPNQIRFFIALLDRI